MIKRDVLERFPQYTNWVELTESERSVVKSFSAGKRDIFSKLVSFEDYIWELMCKAKYVRGRYDRQGVILEGFSFNFPSNLSVYPFFRDNILQGFVIEMFDNVSNNVDMRSLFFVPLIGESKGLLVSSLVSSEECTLAEYLYLTTCKEMARKILAIYSSLGFNQNGIVPVSLHFGRSSVFEKGYFLDFLQEGTVLHQEPIREVD